MQNGAPICVPDCAETVEEMFAECHPRWEVEMDEQTLQGLHDFLAICQGMPPRPGGGHRRQLLAKANAPATPGSFEAQFGGTTPKVATRPGKKTAVGPVPV